MTPHTIADELFSTNFVLSSSSPPDPRLIRVLLVDDNADICGMMGRMARYTRDIELTSLPSTRDLVPTIDHLHPAIVLMDLIIPGESPLEAIRTLRGTHPDVRAIIFSGYDDDETLDKVFDAGAWGLIGKTHEIAGVFDIIRRVAEL